MTESTPAYVTASAEPKSSIEASLGAASTPKGEAAVSVKIYFDNSRPEDLAKAVADCQITFEHMRHWAANHRVPQ